MIAFSCQQCQDAPYQKENLGCESPTQVPATWLDPDEEWYNCPIQFIKQDCWDFFDKYKKYKDGLATPPDFEQQSSRFNSAITVFENYINKFSAMQQGKQ